MPAVTLNLSRLKSQVCGRTSSKAVTLKEQLPKAIAKQVHARAQEAAAVPGQQKPGQGSLPMIADLFRTAQSKEATTPPA